MAAHDVEARRPYQTAILEMAGRVEMGDVNGFEIAANVADKITEASTLEEIMAAANSGPEGLEDIEGKAFAFLRGSLRYAKSAEQFERGGTGFYVIFDCVDLDGIRHTVSTGSVNVVFQLKAMEKLGVFDGEGLSERMFTIKSRPTKNGTLYRLDFA